MRKINNNFKVKRIIYNYDGDTFSCDLFCRTNYFCKNIKIRLFGIDTEEIKHRTIKSFKAKYFLRNWLRTSKKIYLKNCFRGKYYRNICEVLNEKKEDISNLLLKNHLAIIYKSKKKENSTKGG